jgi:Raf kinase inhibitor-like YbhB/YbcL family protein
VLQKLPAELGAALRGQRAGVENVTYQRLLIARKVPRLGLHSSAFADMQSLPPRFTADGAGISPPLEWFGVPDDAGSLALMVEDGDSPTPHPWVHAIAVNLDPESRALAEDALVLGDDDSPAEVDLGLNSLLKRGWLPPDPPPGHGQHRYVFQLFALEPGPALPSSIGRQDMIEVILQHAVAAGCLIGTYERPRPIRAGESANDDAIPDDPLIPART